MAPIGTSPAPSAFSRFIQGGTHELFEIVHSARVPMAGPLVNAGPKADRLGRMGCGKSPIQKKGRIMIRRLLPVLTLVSCLSLAVPALSVAQDLSGVYQCEGVGPNGKPYRGTVEIAKNEQTYRVKWTIAPDGVYLGIGILKDDMLAVSYFGQVVGVVLYKIEKGPRLVGEWTVIGADGQVFSETLTKPSLKAATPEPKKPSPRTALAVSVVR